MNRSRVLPAVTIFLGSFLLFGVQPLVGGMLLPHFGGTAAVWTVCLCSYQTLLVAGYFYAHVLAGRSRRRAFWMHALAMVCAAAWVLFVPSLAKTSLPWLSESCRPAIGALAAVLLVVGLPYVLLSANSSAVQALASRGSAGEGAYRLYSVSNAGSLCGLLAYPFLLEPNVSQNAMLRALSAGLLLYAVLLACLLRSRPAPEEGMAHAPDDGVTGPDRMFVPALGWFGLSAFSCFLLNAVTTQLGQGVSPIPLMWVVLLGAYLLSWIFGFCTLGGFASALVGGVAVLAGIANVVVMGFPADGMYVPRFVLGVIVLFFGCLTAHETLYGLRPSARHLTRFYLLVSLGGAAGGLVASLLFPSVTTFVLEFPVAVTLAAALGAVRVGRFVWNRIEKDNRGLFLIGGTCCVLALLAVSVWFGQATDGDLLARRRNFYSVSTVQLKVARDAQGRECPAMAMDNNGTTHGLQAISYGRKSLSPTTYYTESGGGMAFEQHPLRKAGRPMRVALCGLGIGTLATYGREGDLLRFYEIDPSVIEYATCTNYFTFLSGSEARVEIVPGDARQSLEREYAEPGYDLIVVDVFSGDSIPSHMATKEAFSLYMDRLAPDGMLAIHLSNWHLDLSPMVKAAAREFGLNLVAYVGVSGANPYEFTSYWAYLSRASIDFAPKDNQLKVDFSVVKDIPLMTDGRHSLIPYLGQDPIRRICVSYRCTHFGEGGRCESVR